MTFPTADGLSLDGWFVPSSQSTPATHTVLVFNGNAGNRAYRAPLAAALQREGLQVFLFDYRGYGDSARQRTAHAHFTLRVRSLRSSSVNV